jgi:hypothetical protein
VVRDLISSTGDMETEPATESSQQKVARLDEEDGLDVSRNRSTSNDMIPAGAPEAQTPMAKRCTAGKVSLLSMSTDFSTWQIQWQQGTI